MIGLELLGRLALLRSLAVRKKYRGQGWGKKLVNEIEEYASGQGIEQLYLLTTTAVDFFNRQGYQTVDRHSVPGVVQQTAEFQSLCPASTVCMVKSLNLQTLPV